MIYMSPQMGKKRSHDHIAIQSSIALLQERFKQLERVKEMREERELSSRMLELHCPPPKRLLVADPVKLQNESCRFLFHRPELILLQPKSPTGFVSSFSFRPNSQGERGEVHHHHHHQCVEMPLLMSLWSIESNTTTTTQAMRGSREKVDDSANGDDIDTSLHL